MLVGPMMIDAELNMEDHGSISVIAFPEKPEGENKVKNI
jgi:hypothetical protein